MPYVELLEDVAEGGRSLAKACAAADAFGLDKGDSKYPRLKVTLSKLGRIEFRKGLVVMMNDDGAKKWVDRGIGKVVPKPQPKIVSVEMPADAEGKTKKVVKMDA